MFGNAMEMRFKIIVSTENHSWTHTMGSPYYSRNILFKQIGEQKKA